MRALLTFHLLIHNPLTIRPRRLHRLAPPPRSPQASTRPPSQTRTRLALPELKTTRNRSLESTNPLVRQLDLSGVCYGYSAKWLILGPSRMGRASGYVAGTACRPP